MTQNIIFFLNIHIEGEIYYENVCMSQKGNG